MLFLCLPISVKALKRQPVLHYNELLSVLTAVFPVNFG